MATIQEKLSVLANTMDRAEGLSSEQLAEEKNKITVVDFKMVTFSLSGKDYAIDIMKVKEIAKAGRFTYVPNALPFVRGVYNLRGDIIPIIDLRLFFNSEVHEHDDDYLENLLIVSVGEQTFGIVVDEIDKVVGIQKSSIQPPHPLFAALLNPKTIFMFFWTLTEFLVTELQKKKKNLRKLPKIRQNCGRKLNSQNLRLLLKSLFLRLKSLLKKKKNLFRI